MNRRRDQDDDFDAFDDPLLDDAFKDDSLFARDRQDELDILKSIEDDKDDDLLEEIGRPRRRGSGGGGGLDLGALIGGLFSVVFTAIFIAALCLIIGAGIVIGARALGILEGGAVSFNFAGGALSAIVPTQPVAIPTTAPLVDAPAAPPAEAAAIVPTQVAVVPTAVPSSTPIPECRPADMQAWWALQQDNFNTFTSLTIAAVTAESNLNAFMERLRLRREYSAAATVPNLPEPCIANARAALLNLFDNTMTWARAAANLPGTDPAALPQAEIALSAARADMTAALWEIRVIEEPDSPVALNVGRGSGAACGAAAWLAQVNPQYQQFKDFAGQINVVTLPANTVRGLITNMQSAQGNTTSLVVPECAAEPNRLLQAAMTAQITAYENQLAGRADTASSGFAEYVQLDARFRAWVAWLEG